MVALAGAPALITRARELAAIGDLPLACHLVDAVLKAQPENRDAWGLWKELFDARATPEVNLMARNVYKGAAAEADRRLS
jgi:alkyl sulfatase BDS1-like metallo-beta-lactamase superfamily hydrolase